MAKPKKNTFKLSVKTEDGLSAQSSGECGVGMAFALYMLPMGSSEEPQDKEGTAAEFLSAQAAYLRAATKYRAELEAKRAPVEPTGAERLANVQEICRAAGVAVPERLPHLLPGERVDFKAAQRERKAVRS